MARDITPLIDPTPGTHGRRLVWLASGANAVPVGSAFLRLFTDPGREHVADLSLGVVPEQRRKGLGTKLLDAALAAAQNHERRHVTAHANAGSSGDHFLLASGFDPVLTLDFVRLSLADLDDDILTEIVRTEHPGYRLLSWHGTVPDEYAQTFADARRAMADMPMGGSSVGTVTWDVERVRSAAAAVERRGDQLHTVATVDVASDTIAGFTELVVPGDGTGDAQHYGTAVLPEHRGHALGRWMKAESIRLARKRYPDLEGLLADTADVNIRMRQINDALGYRHTHTRHLYQLELQA